MTSFEDIQIPWVPLPFATYDINKSIALGKNDSEVAHWIVDGLSPRLGAPQKNGVALTRHHLNKIGFAATIGCFLDQCGYQPGFSHMPAGGWPKDAIITEIVDGEVREWLNTVENNIAKPEVPKGEMGMAAPSNGWKPIWGVSQFDMSPDYERAEEVLQTQLTYSGYAKDFTFEETVWLSVTRTIDNWEATTTNTKVPVTITHRNLPVVSITAQEGPTVTRMIPVCGTISVSGRSIDSEISATLQITKIPIMGLR